MLARVYSSVLLYYIIHMQCIYVALSYTCHV